MYGLIVLGSATVGIWKPPLWAFDDMTAQRHSTQTIARTRAARTPATTRAEYRKVERARHYQGRVPESP